jgi:RHS repeat-associated protein
MVTPGLTIQSSAPLANANYNPTGDPITNGTEGKRIYELTNHLGNVMVTISDRKIGVDENSDAVIDYYKAEVLTAQDYYAFGMMMPGRTYSNAGAKYKYGFNGQEKSDEVAGEGNSYTAEYWQYDARLGRRWNVDPITKPYESPFVGLGNNPISVLDPNGADTINFNINTVRRKLNQPTSQLSWLPAKQIPDWVTTTGNIDVTAARGDDVFRVNHTTTIINEDGSSSTTTETTTLDVRGVNSLGRNGGHNMKGYLDDRYALAAYAPTWLLDYYGSKNKGYDTYTEWGIGAAKAYQKDVPFAAGLNKVTQASYTIAGAFGIFRFALSKMAIKATMQSELQFTQQQVWKKFSEHYKEFGLTHSQEGMEEYLRIAQEVHRNPIIKHTFPQTEYYRGETWMINNGRILRLDPEGKFRALYMLK